VLSFVEAALPVELKNKFHRQLEIASRFPQLPQSRLADSLPRTVFRPVNHRFQLEAKKRVKKTTKELDNNLVHRRLEFP
jgi:hypothetical protein